MLKAVKGTRAVIATSQDHEGALGNIVAGALLEGGLDNGQKFKKMGVNDQFGQTAKPFELVSALRSSRLKHMAETAIGLLGA